MAREQKERDDLKEGVIAVIKGENEVVGETLPLDGIERDGKIEKEEKKLTFVSSLTFADMILEFFHTEKKKTEGAISLNGLTGSTVSSIQPPPFSPLFSSPSSPSPSSTSLDVKGSKYGVELALLRREGAYVTLYDLCEECLILSNTFLMLIRIPFFPFFTFIYMVFIIFIVSCITISFNCAVLYCIRY
jgi:hypothetical protein